MKHLALLLWLLPVVAYAANYELHPGDTASVWTPATSTSPAPSPAELPTPLALPTAAGCPATVPGLINAHSPVAYGADPTGVNDSGPGFRAALAVGDLDVPAGTFRFASTVTVPNGRGIKCETDAILKRTDLTVWTMFLFNNNSSGGMWGCHFWGPNYNAHPPTLGNYAQRFIFHQSLGTAGTAGHLIFANNDFNGIGGYVGAIQIYGSSSYNGGTNNQPPPNGDQVLCNTAENSGHYFLQISSALNTSVRGNVTVDSNCCVESDNNLQQMNGNVIDQHTSTFTYGTGYAQGHMDGYHNYLTGGASCSGGGCNFSGNTVSNSSCGGTKASWLAETAQGGSQNNAHYVNNSVSGSCTVH